MRTASLSEKILDFLLLAVIGFHLAVSPYTKVEESFNIQAVHDIVNFGIYPQSTILSNYDHVEFPGVVPRTFIGSLLLAGAVKMLTFFNSLSTSGTSQLNLQLLTRLVLGLANGISLIRIRNSVNKVCVDVKNFRSRRKLGFWFSLVLLSQFHLLYYSSRTLPNFIALPFTNHAVAKLLAGEMSGLAWLAFSGIVFRLEIGVFAVIIAFVSSLVYFQSNPFHNVLMLVAGTIAGLVSTFLVDSYFWGYRLIPELVSFVFNIVHGKSADWGVEPWSAYFTKYLFQIFRPPTLLALILPILINDPADDGRRISPETKKRDAYLLNHPAKNSLFILYTSSILYIAVMSFQPHKEWRFIVYTFPILALQAANVLTHISNRCQSSVGYRFLRLFFFLNLMLGLALSVVMGYVSSFNYPGGDSITFLNGYLAGNNLTSSAPVMVHMDTASCMSGITRFTQLHGSNIVFDKTENDGDLLKQWNDIDFLITEACMDTFSRKPGSKYDPVFLNPTHWDLIHTSQKFEGVTILPIINLLQDQSRKANLIPELFIQMLSEAKTGIFTTGFDFLDQMIIKKDYLYIYKRTEPDDLTSEDIQSRLSEDEPHGALREEEEVLLGFEQPPLENVKFEDIGDDVNREIDSLESQAS